eukprot:2379263-Rhodomonas_salina.6
MPGLSPYLPTSFLRYCPTLIPLPAYALAPLLPYALISLSAYILPPLSPYALTPISAYTLPPLLPYAHSATSLGSRPISWLTVRGTDARRVVRPVPMPLDMSAVQRRCCRWWAPCCCLFDMGPVLVPPCLDAMLPFAEAMRPYGGDALVGLSSAAIYGDGAVIYGGGVVFSLDMSAV